MAKKSKKSQVVPKTAAQIEEEARWARVSDQAAELAKNPLRTHVALFINRRIEEEKVVLKKFEERLAKNAADAFEWTLNEAMFAAAKISLLEGLMIDLNLQGPVLPLLEEIGEGHDDWQRKVKTEANQRAQEAYERQVAWWTTNPRIDSVVSREKMTRWLIGKASGRPMNSSSAAANLMEGYKVQALAALLQNWDGWDRIVNFAARREAMELEGFDVSGK